MFSSLNNHSVYKVTTMQGIYQIYLSKSEPTNKTRAEDACFIRNNDISLQVQKIHINTMLTQQEQDLITETLHQLGIKDEYKFDSYLEAFNWNE